MKKTKIIATIGPSSRDTEVIKELILNGMDIARINLTHASHEFAKDVINKIDNLNKELNTSVSIMFDLEGPDINVGKFAGGSAYLTKNSKIRIYMDDILGDSTKFSINYPKLIDEIKVNTVIKLDDGLIELNVIDKELNYLLCEVVTGGFIENNKGLNVIGTKIRMPFLTKKDKEDIKFACEQNIDYLALSLIRSSEDVLEVNDLLINLNNDHISIISKIENESAIDDIDEIIRNSDAIMVARGDLGVELPMERIPGIQKMIINKCHMMSKVSIVATEMMSTMENAVRPTRAEVSDVANAVLDGVDVVMLSGETTIGKYPIETLKIMTKIIESSELDQNYLDFLDKTMRTEKQDITGSVAYSSVECALRLKCNAIVTPTMSGYTARKISRFRPSCIVIALCPNVETVKSLNIYYGIYPVLVDEIKSFDKMMDLAKKTATKILRCDNGKIIVTGGYPFNEVKHTNFMKIEEI
ncbi:MAG: pyruvate kinase [Bacilli bacterium]|nr:pyruvate kinase [Bacilli bacterium]